MTLPLLYGLGGVALFSLGLYGLLVHRHSLRQVLSLNTSGAGAFLILVALSRRDAATDPVPQALVLTGIVVTVAATATALALARRLARDRAEQTDQRPPRS